MFVSRVQRSTIVLTRYSANRVVNNSGFNLHKVCLHLAAALALLTGMQLLVGCLLHKKR